MLQSLQLFISTDLKFWSILIHSMLLTTSQNNQYSTTYKQYFKKRVANKWTENSCVMFWKTILKYSRNANIHSKTGEIQSYFWRKRKCICNYSMDMLFFSTNFLLFVRYTRKRAFLMTRGALFLKPH